MRFDAVVVPRGAEERAVRRGWRAAGTPIVAVAAGAAAVQSLDALNGAASVLVLGLCGALAPHLRIGDAVVYRDVCEASAPDAAALDAAYSAELASRLGAPLVRGAHAAAVVSSVAAKGAFARGGASVVDMESLPLAHAFARRGIRAAVLRVVSDDALHDLPDLAGAYDSSGRLRPGALAAALLRDPLRGARFVRGAIRGLRALSRAAERVSARE